MLSGNTLGLTAGYGILVRADCADNLRLLAHEFVHVAQYERLGRVGFLQEYIQQIAAHGYLNAPFELDAEARASNACHAVRTRTVLQLLEHPTQDQSFRSPEIIPLRGVLAGVGFQDPQHFRDRLRVLMRAVARRDDMFALRAVQV